MLLDTYNNIIRQWRKQAVYIAVASYSVLAQKNPIVFTPSKNLDTKRWVKKVKKYNLL